MKRNNGSVLIIALLMIAFVEIIMLSLMKHHQLEIRYINSVANSSQNYQLLLGGQAWAKGLVKSLMTKESNQRVYRLPRTQFGDKFVSAELIDMQSLINLNTINQSNQDAFRAVLNTLEIDANSSQINKLLSDFSKIYVNKQSESDLDGESLDDTSSAILEGFGGIQNLPEDFDYTEVQEYFRSQYSGGVSPDIPEEYKKLLQERLKQTQNTGSNSINKDLMLVSPSEIMEMGIAQKDFVKLKPFVTTLPDAVPLNVNTASYLSLLMLDPTLTIENTKSITQLRDAKGGFEILDEFTSFLPSTDINLSDESVTLLSEYFLAVSIVEQKEFTQKMYALLKSSRQQEDSDKVSVSVIWQSMGTQ